MWRNLILALIAVSLAAVATTVAQARDGDMRGEDSRADWQYERSAEATIDVPRNADGSIDGQTFVNEVDSLVARGVRVIHIRDASFTHEEARSLLIPLEGNLIGHLAARLPNDGIQRQITLRGDVDVRVQRKANGELRASIKDLVVGNPTEARRAEFAQQLAEKYGLDRLSVRAIDAQGNRLRVEYRADQGIVRNESRAGHGGDREYHAGRHDKRRAEAKLDVPRNADGSIDGQTFVNEVDSLIARGVRVIHFRDSSFTQGEARSLLIPLDGNLIGELAQRLPNDGIQRQITVRGEVDVRVQRQANGDLRASIKDLVVVNPTEARRAEFAQQLAEKYGLDRLSVRAIDAQGNRLRVEYRADQGIVRNESRAGHGSGREVRADRGKDRGKELAARDERRDGRKDHADHRNDRDETRAERRKDGMDRAMTRTKFERKERVERPERREDRMDRPERHAKFERHERHERHERAERPERAERAERVERPDRASRH